MIKRFFKSKYDHDFIITVIIFTKILKSRMVHKNDQKKKFFFI